MFELKETNILKIINNFAKNFYILFDIIVKDKKDFCKVDIAKIKILKDFNKAIYLDKKFNIEKNCFKDITIVDFCFASIKATTLIFLIVNKF